MSENHLKCISEMVYEGDVANNWKKFKQRFEIYNNATEGCKKSEKTQISVLLHLMGEEAIELYGTFEFGVDEGDLKLEDVIDKFDGRDRSQRVD
ncbi:hypothetical protein M8J77_023188 [Diaphorina citri]|nr:hypothetical protein M8J77_023188 [Diaphorina citri]